jgi:allantoinase
MDHEHYAYSALARRPTLRWPADARLAYSVFLYLEAWDVDPPGDAVTDPRMKDSVAPFYPDYRTSTRMEYGNRVGIFRLFELLDRHQLKVTVPANMMALERYPFLVDECLKRGYELAGHGIAATQMLSSKMSEEQERDVIGQSLSAIHAASGSWPAGWIGQDYGQSARTPRLLAEAGLGYMCDWPNDDAPYLTAHINPKTGLPLVSLPNQAEWDDVQLLWHRKTLTQRFPVIAGEAFDVLHAEGGRYFGLHLHPWLFGMPYRTRYLAQTLQQFAHRRGVWQATAGDVARHAGHVLWGQDRGAT